MMKKISEIAEAVLLICGSSLPDDVKLAQIRRIAANRINPARVRLEIPFRLPSLNEYVNACRGSAHDGARFKKGIEEQILWEMRGKRELVTGPVIAHFIWYEPNRKRDKDNVAAAKKFILDAFQKGNILPNDGNRNILGFTDSFVYGMGGGVSIELEEAQP